MSNKCMVRLVVMWIGKILCWFCGIKNLEDLID